MDEAVSNALLDEIKSSLRITWDDEDNDLKRLIQRSESYLNDLTGVSLDFSKEDQSKTLLFERCRYVYNNAAEEFEGNFQHELSRLILKAAIESEREMNGTS